MTTTTVNKATRADRRVGIYTLIATFGALSYGYDTGVISGALPFMSLPGDQGGLNLTSFEEGLVSASLIFGAAFGAIFSGRLSDKRGRRINLLILAVVFIIGSLGATLAPNVAVMIIFRFILGLGVGGASATVPTFIAELAPASRRATLVSRNEFMIVFGQLLAYTTNAGIANFLPGDHSWRWMLAICLIPGAALFIGMLFVPESPRWLGKRGRYDEARTVLQRLRTGDVETELGEIRDRSEEARRDQLAPRQAIRVPWIRRIIIIGAVLGICLQFTGVNAVVYYAPTILVQTGLGTAAALTATIGNGVVSVLAVTLGIFLLRVAPRRRLLLIGIAGIVVSLTLLGLSFMVLPQSAFRSYTVLAFMLVFLFFQQTFFAVVYWLLMSEIFPLRIRGYAVGIAVFVKWIANTLIVLFFPVLISTLGGPTFFIFAAVNVAAFFFVLKVLPETKGKTLEGFELELENRDPALMRPGVIDREA
jgi:major inositol transporter-like SP family MFS transporter